jgi:GNAT superfamily N-acetyltransferase
MTTRKPGIRIRTAEPDDVEALAQIKSGPGLHRDRIAAQVPGRLYVFVAGQDEKLCGFGMLVLDQVPDWPEVQPLPQIIDLFVADDARGRGVGSALIGAMEDKARDLGWESVHLRVEPEANPRALALYERLDYRQLFDKPRRDVYDFVDSDGVRHQGVEWVVDMRKDL